MTETHVNDSCRYTSGYFLVVLAGGKPEQGQQPNPKIKQKTKAKAETKVKAEAQDIKT